MTLILILALVASLQSAIALQRPFSLNDFGDNNLQSNLPIPSSGGKLRRYSHPGAVQSVLDVAVSHDLDIWQLSSSYVDVYFPPHRELPEELKDVNCTVSEIPPDLDLRTTSGNLAPWNLSTVGPANNTFHSNYHPLHEIDQFMNEISVAFPETVEVFELGHTAQGREMLGIKISKVSDDNSRRKKPRKKSKFVKGGGVGKPGFVIMGAQHAREWVATSTSMFLAHSLVTSLESLLDNFDFYVIPSPNPDGYAYTWESDRYWYKNRQIMGPNAKCVGLDMGRNWGYKWKSRATDGGDNLGFKAKEPQVPVDPCSHWYPGHRAFESPEVNNIANFITTLPNLRVFLDLRAYGQMLSAPYSYSCEAYPRDAEDQMEAATGAGQAMAQLYGTKVRVGTLCEQLYQAPGNVVDWMYKKAGIKYTYAVHLRDTGTYGFSLPPEWIRPVGEETVRMVQYFAKFVRV
ncbi:hypothetical protein GYMLUDRAFT_40174 [Collybiopsis luxurians FD-317 M1]|uniref:Peptidase M14 domain-containing protein n=1 Tax=Collybiopsis luxurians FD-317 M1 TaxID=944289 RepID=A0A0D0CW41_9AGAR|nr:hypothetical protein GYMLUDRAFT_40174 [Collybiopsis luxurians FD-317 M1]